MKPVLKEIGSILNATQHMRVMLQIVSGVGPHVLERMMTEIHYEVLKLLRRHFEWNNWQRFLVYIEHQPILCIADEQAQDGASFLRAFVDVARLPRFPKPPIHYDPNPLMSCLVLRVTNATEATLSKYWSWPRLALQMQITQQYNVTRVSQILSAVVTQRPVRYSGTNITKEWFNNLHGAPVRSLYDDTKVEIAIDVCIGEKPYALNICTQKLCHIHGPSDLSVHKKESALEIPIQCDSLLVKTVQTWLLHHILVERTVGGNSGIKNEFVAWMLLTILRCQPLTFDVTIHSPREWLELYHNHMKQSKGASGCLWWITLVVLRQPRHLGAVDALRRSIIQHAVIHRSSEKTTTTCGVPPMMHHAVVCDGRRWTCSTRWWWIFSNPFSTTTTPTTGTV